MNFDRPAGATPLDPDEAVGLIPSHITTQGQLNEWEMTNILAGESWAFSRTHKELLSSEFICQLHKRMFGDTWRWAGRFRTTEKNIGIDPAGIQPALRNLCEDVKVQLDLASYPLDEIAARFSHRLVAIHPYANGNGRLSRTIADLLLVHHGAPRFTWGGSNLVADGEVKQCYLAALRAADGKDYGSLLRFVRS
ncbi:MAG TPA: mobile mystery protein B [Burkholderiaceae bacterium]|nr:mobile mystery protein B [Burkholderiaceae bacterium]